MVKIAIRIREGEYLKGLSLSHIAEAMEYVDKNIYMPEVKDRYIDVDEKSFQVCTETASEYRDYFFKIEDGHAKFYKIEGDWKNY